MVFHRRPVGDYLDNNTSDAIARQQGVPDVGNDESDFVADNGCGSDSDSSSEPAAEHAPRQRQYHTQTSMTRVGLR